jgi:pantothenate kinase
MFWFIDVDRESARARLVKRHVVSGIVPDVAAVSIKFEYVFLEREWYLEDRLRVDEVIPGS